MSQSNTVTISRTKNGYVVTVTGQGTRQQSPSVRDFVSGAMEDGAEVVLDLSPCTYLDSTFLGCLVILHKRGCEYSNRFRVHAGEEVVKQLLRPTRLDTILPFCGELPAITSEAVDLPIVELPREEFGEHLLNTHEELAALDSPSSAAFRMVCDQLKKELGED